MELVDCDERLAPTCGELANAPVVYLDTEFQSSRAGSELCLLQVSTGEKVYLFDTLRLRTLSPLVQVLGRSECEWVLHAGDQDVRLLEARLGVTPPARLFDTQIAWAMMSAEPSVSLAYLVYRVLGLRTAKGHQADDWKRRPLPLAQLNYAAGDVRHLPALHQRLTEKASALGRGPTIWQASREQLLPEPEAPVRLEYEAFRNAWQLDAGGRAALYYLIEWYNGLTVAERSAAPDAKTLLAIAGRLPDTIADLGRIKGVPRRCVDRHGEQLVRELLRAAAAVESANHVPIDPSPYATFWQAKVDAWLLGMRAEICDRLQVAPDLALPSRWLRHARDLLGQGAEVTAVISELTGWRQSLLAAAMFAYAAECPPPAQHDGKAVQQAWLSSGTRT